MATIVSVACLYAEFAFTTKRYSVLTASGMTWISVSHFLLPVLDPVLQLKV